MDTGHSHFLVLSKMPRNNAFIALGTDLHEFSEVLATLHMSTCARQNGCLLQKILPMEYILPVSHSETSEVKVGSLL